MQKISPVVSVSGLAPKSWKRRYGLGETRQARFTSALALRHQEKTSLEQEAKAGLLVGSLVCLVGLLCHLLPVMTVVVMMAMVLAMMMVMAMMLCHRSRIRTRRTDDRRRESECNCKP
ncbi:hypothetical protein ACVDG5_006000 [Mesorhizobium sp. ORM6]